MFPSISDYISSIEGAADTLNALNYLRPVLKPNGQPYFSSGNFAVVFKMLDTRTGNHMALKCFLRDVPDRARRLRLIGEWIAENPSPYLLPMTYHADELWVDCAHSDREEFDVVMMPWVEGVTLGEYVRTILSATFNRPASLSFQFDKMAYWLLASCFAHGDLKPDNILVDERKNLRLIDYDGAYVPTLQFDDALENGTPPYQHPKREGSYFDQHIDDFSILALSLELHALTEKRNLFVGGDSLLLPAWFSKQPFNNDVWSKVRSLCSDKVSARAGLLEFASHMEAGKISGLKELLPDEQIPELPDLIPFKNNNNWGFCDRDMKIVIDCYYSEVNLFNGQLASVKHKGKWGFIDIKGEEVIPIMYDEVYDFDNGFARVKQWGKIGCIDKKGNILVPIDYNYIGPFFEGLAYARKGGRSQGANRKLFPSFNFNVEEDKSQIGFLSIKANGFTPLDFDRIGDISEGLSVAVIADDPQTKYSGESFLKGKYGFIDTNGRVVIPLVYEQANAFSDGVARVTKNGKWGLIDKNGKTITQLEFDEIRYFSEGLAAVKYNNKWGYIDKTGTVTIKIQYDRVTPFKAEVAEVCPFFILGNSNTSHFINKKGLKIIKLPYNEKASFHEGLAWVSYGETGGFIDKKGREILKINYDLTNYDISGYCYIEDPSFFKGLSLITRYGYIDRFGNRYWKDSDPTPFEGNDADDYSPFVSNRGDDDLPF